MSSSGAVHGQIINIADNPRIPVLLDLVSNISKAANPEDVVNAFAYAMRMAYGPRGFIILRTHGLRPGQYRIMRFQTSNGQDRISPPKDWIAVEHLLVHEGGFLAGLIDTPVPKLVHGLSVRNDPVLGNQLSEYRSALC